MSVPESPLVSIVTPSFNQAPFLEATICSVLAQDYPRVEYFIIDGNSTDGSVEIIKHYETHLAAWVSEPDGGQADAINKGWRRAHGEFVAYLNSDDTLEPHAVSASIAALQAHPHAALSYGSCHWIDAQGKTIGLIPAQPFTLRDLLLQNRLAQPTVFVRRSALEEVGVLDPALHYLMDYDLWLRLVLHFPVARVDQVLANFRLHHDSKTASRYKFFLDDNLRLLEKAFLDSDLPDELQALRPRAENYAFLLTALQCYSYGRPDDGRAIFQRWFETYAQPLAYSEDIVSLFADHLVHVAPMQQTNAGLVQGEAWLDSVMEDLPANATALRSYRSQIIACTNLTLGFAAHSQGNSQSARAYMLRALEHHPAYARNRGVWSVLLKSTLRPAPKAVSV